jgi:hypothetical protein
VHVLDGKFAEGIAMGSNLEVSRSMGDFKWKWRNKGIANRAKVKGCDEALVIDQLYSLLR